MSIITLFIIFLISILFTYFFKKNSKNFDLPNKRSSHTVPVPTSGGVTFCTISFLYIIYDISLNSLSNKNIIFLFCLPLSLVGYIDDQINLKRKYRFLSQFFVVASLISIFLFSKEDYFLNSINLPQLFIPIIFFVLLFFGIGLINLINFMDGMDGLVSSCLALTFLYIGLTQNNLTLIITFSLLGFLVFNWSPASIFMGDTGSTFLGGILLASILQSKDFLEFFNLLFINLPIIADSTSCLLLRLFKKQNIFEPHKLHLYQRLNQNGWSHSKVSLLYLFASGLMLCSITLGNARSTIISSFVILIGGLTINKKFALKFE